MASVAACVMYSLRAVLASVLPTTPATATKPTKRTNEATSTSTMVKPREP